MPVPVTARLSKHFYERLGEQVANELVDWFNAVDATYKAELREFNELNFARFDAKVDQRFAESDAKVERRLAEFEAKVERRFAEFERRFVEFRSSIEDKLGAQTRFMYLAWATIMAAVIGFGLR
jgi:Skp family chaperone for outer membrane proteins